MTRFQSNGSVCETREIKGKTGGKKWQLTQERVKHWFAASWAWAEQRYPIEEKPEWSTGKYIQRHS